MKHVLHINGITAASAGLLLACSSTPTPPGPVGAPGPATGGPGEPATPTSPTAAPTEAPLGQPVGGAVEGQPAGSALRTLPPSCADAPMCSGIDCCESPLVRGGTFPMGRSTTGADAFKEGFDEELPEHSASVSAFRLDTFEVTVGRFRKFLKAYAGPPATGAGAHPKLKGTGWTSAWNAEMPKDKAAFLEFAGQFDCGTDFKPWTDEAGPNESLPMTCVTWYEAFAFCAWDGGRLPSDAEWEYAAAGGAENRLYPWGNMPPSRELASFECLSDGNPACEKADLPKVGTKPAGAARWGQRDMAGSAFEWTMDWYDPAWYSGAGRDCKDCVNVTRPDTDLKIFRGGDFKDGAVFLRNVVRMYSPPAFRADNVGFRCARPTAR